MPINITATDQSGADFLRQAKLFFRGLMEFLSQEENESEHQPGNQNQNPLQNQNQNEDEDLQHDLMPPNTTSPSLIPMNGPAPQREVQSLPPKEAQIRNNSGGQQEESLPNPTSAAANTAVPVPQTNGMSKGAGVMFMSPNGSILFLRRSGEGDEAGKWAFPGGRVESGETTRDAAVREVNEEIGDCGHDCGRMVQADQRQVGATNFTTYLSPAPTEFQPQLNGEHTSYAWRPLDNPPQPLHPGVQQTLQSLHGPAPRTASGPVATDPLTGKGEKIMSSMQDQYGSEKGKQVFYASKNKGNISGVDNRRSSWGAPRWSRDQPAAPAQAVLAPNSATQPLLQRRRHDPNARDTDPAQGALGQNAQRTPPTQPVANRWSSPSWTRETTPVAKLPGFAPPRARDTETVGAVPQPTPQPPPSGSQNQWRVRNTGPRGGGGAHEVTLKIKRSG
jgi:8-oxo-dGTP pyrophosphatase MutT (NUDIX family)